MFIYKDYAKKMLPLQKAYAAQELAIYTKVELLVEWQQCKANRKCPFSSVEIRKMALDLVEINSFRYGGDFEKFKNSTDYRMGRMTVMANEVGNATNELIAELHRLADELKNREC